MTDIAGTAKIQATAEANLFNQPLTGFAKQFSEFDTEIMAELGDELTLTAPSGYTLNPKCILSNYPGTGQDGFVLSDNMQTKIDVYSVLVEVLAVDVPGLSNKWTARYLDEDYAVSDSIPRGDGTLLVILNKPGNTEAVASGWR